jgi:hypothetical protein
MRRRQWSRADLGGAAAAMEEGRRVGLDADRRWEWREGWKRGRRLDGGRRRARMGGEAVETATAGDGVRGWEARRGNRRCVVEGGGR